MDELCDSIIKDIEITELTERIDEKLDRILDRQIRDRSFFGILFVAVTTLVTNLWAQYVYNNMVTNFGRGTHGFSDSLLMLFVYTLFAISIAILFVIDLRSGLI